MKKTIIILLMAFLLVLPLMDAQDQYTYKAGEVSDLKIPFEVDGEAASSSATCNISIQYPNGSYLVSNTPMTNLNNGEFNYTFYKNQTKISGGYKWVAYCCDGSKCASGYDNFEITPSGKSGTSNIIFFLFLILMLYGINLLGFFGENETMTLLGGMALIFLGVYLINNGIIIYRDNLTNYFSYITIAWGTVSCFMAAYSWYKDM